MRAYRSGDVGDVTLEGGEEGGSGGRRGGGGGEEGGGFDAAVGGLFSKSEGRGTHPRPGVPQEDGGGSLRTKK